MRYLNNIKIFLQIAQCYFFWVSLTLSIVPSLFVTNGRNYSLPSLHTAEHDVEYSNWDFRGLKSALGQLNDIMHDQDLHHVLRCKHPVSRPRCTTYKNLAGIGACLFGKQGAANWQFSFTAL